MDCQIKQKIQPQVPETYTDTHLELNSNYFKLLIN